MAEKSKIAWTDSTLNFWEGCSKVSAGCQSCYAETRDKHWHNGQNWGSGGIRRKSKSAVKDALRLNAKPWICDGCGHAVAERSLHCPVCVSTKLGWHRRRIFSLSLGDWLEGPPISTMKDGTPIGGIPVEWRAEFLDTVRICSDVEFILCTKRIGDWWARITEVIEHVEGGKIEDIGDRFPETELGDWLNEWTGGNAPKNVTILASVEDQATADTRIPALLRIPAARRGLSLEPLLGPVDLTDIVIADGRPGEWHVDVLSADEDPQDDPDFNGATLDWLIIGGESGNRARYCNQTWIRSLIAQAKAASVPVFIKQMGSHPCMSPTGVTGPEVCMQHFRYKDNKGADPSEWPEDLRVQDWPEGMR